MYCNDVMKHIMYAYTSLSLCQCMEANYADGAVFDDVPSYWTMHWKHNRPFEDL